MAGFLKVLGLIGWAIGVWLLFSGFQMSVTINPDGTGEVANLHLMHIQQLNLLLGAFAILDGTILAVGGWIIDSLRDQTDRLLRSEPPPKVDDLA